MDSSPSPPSSPTTPDSTDSSTSIEMSPKHYERESSAERTPAGSDEDAKTDEQDEGVHSTPVPMPKNTQTTSSSAPTSILVSSKAPSPAHPNTTHPYPRTTFAPQPRSRRSPALTPLSPASTNSVLPLGQGQLPQSQPLARTLFARIANDTPHAGMGLGVQGKKKTGSTKLIVPTKSFRTTFELGLTASELARR